MMITCPLRLPQYGHLHIAEMPITIRIRDNGPFVISADEASQVRLEDSAGNEILPTPGKNISLCRCGQSLKRPFCDGTHKTCGFESAAASFANPGATPPTPPAAPTA